MFIYELLTLHQPFEGHESVKECILEGGRPPLTYRVSDYIGCLNTFQNEENTTTVNTFSNMYQQKLAMP
jgi:hypothetical protein